MSGRVTRPPAAPARSSPRWAFPALCAVAAAVIAVVYAEPIQDGDLFWHLAYGEQMLDRGTLIPDHTLYSWTPTSDSTIYCAWLAELFLLEVWRLFDFTGLHLLRYVVVGGALALLWRYAALRGMGRSPVTVLVVLLVALASKGGTIVKPELFSLLLFTGVVFAWFRARLVARTDGDPRRWLVAVPLLLLVWVNTHGGFILVTPFLVATALGELVNARFAPDRALPRRWRTWLFGSWAACLLAVIVTPYGPAYPLQLLDHYVIDPLPRPDTAWNVAHLPIWDSRVLGLHLVEFGIVFAVLLGVAFVRRVVQADRAVDWALVLAVAVYVPLYLFQLRSAFLFPIVAGFAVLELLGRDDPEKRNDGRRGDGVRPLHRPAVAVLTALGVLALGARAGYAAYAAPPSGSWLGFGESYVNPVVEADFVQREELGPRIYNIFDSGGYLLWRLHPDVEVMVDSRSFPYLSWFDDQFAFANGRDVGEFIERYEADVAVIDLLKVGTWASFLELEGWQLTFYGPTAAVFERDPDRRLLDAEDPLWEWVRDLRNTSAALNAFEFATAVGDYPTAWAVLDELRSDLDHQIVEPERRADAFDYQQAYEALLEERFDEALALFGGALDGRAVADRDQLVLDLLTER
ncbi:MAG TPA: hypothetical protein VD926_08985, partial [Acidimicrobiales bacterium]|nr:hypothetical protein [Acidimicrobiales bacterium]